MAFFPGCCAQKEQEVEEISQTRAPTLLKLRDAFGEQKVAPDSLSEGSTEAPPSDLIHSRAAHFVRTSADAEIEPMEALQALILGNERFRSGKPHSTHAKLSMRKALVAHGQAPMAAVVGCADSRCPVETLFDAMPGDLFVLRNAGNTITHAEGSMVGSLEYCVCALETKLILVLGHTGCGAIAGATKTYLANKKKPADQSEAKSSLQGLLEGLSTVVEKAESELGATASADQIAAKAVKVNVFHTIEFLLKFSQPIRDLVRQRKIEIQGAVYNLNSGAIEMIGRSPNQHALLSSEMGMPPSVAPDA